MFVLGTKSARMLMNSWGGPARVHLCGLPFLHVFFAILHVFCNSDSFPVYVSYSFTFSLLSSTFFLFYTITFLTLSLSFTLSFIYLFHFPLCHCHYLLDSRSSWLFVPVRMFFHCTVNCHCFCAFFHSPNMVAVCSLCPGSPCWFLSVAIGLFGCTFFAGQRSWPFSVIPQSPHTVHA